MAADISFHATERMLERSGFTPAKFRKVVRKAWTSTETTDILLKHLDRPKKLTDKYRSFMGCLFVFDCSKDVPILVTVINPKAI